ncbi:MAG: 50S ribosomal protein L13 [Ignavibacteriaceae bacterium]|nr:50S ribosomal protein L13 [Ignavibacteriaceae bacterium]NUM69248.1 50S ribosomal protein L13 [Ignavibacteriaceae bacterium]
MKQEKQTRWVSTGQAERKWFVIDAQDMVLGRLATKVASVIRGKNKPTFSPNADTGDFVIVLNADKVVVTGKRAQLKEYKHHSGYPGGQKTQLYKELKVKNPEFVVKHAVKGMLPKTRLGNKLIKKLKVYRGAEHPHTAQQPEVLS